MYKKGKAPEKEKKEHHVSFYKIYDSIIPMYNIIQIFFCSRRNGKKDAPTPNVMAWMVVVVELRRLYFIMLEIEIYTYFSIIRTLREMNGGAHPTEIFPNKG